jgi:urea transporter
MKKIIILLILSLSTFSMTAQSDWNVSKNHKLTLNYQTLGKSYVRGIGVGGLGFATGMLLSENKTGWGIAGSLLAVNLHLLLDDEYKTPEKIIGFNTGALSIAVGLKISIDAHRKENKPAYKIKPFLRM